jgi:GNAT superfamily N-acetyltransferase
MGQRMAERLFVISELDKERFGVRTAKATNVPARGASSLVASCLADGVGLIIARCATTDSAAAQELESRGFRLMDTLVYWTRDVTDEQAKAYRPAVPTRPMQDSDAIGVRQVSEGAFSGYFGHYHADPRLARRQCDEVYADWARRLCLDRGGGRDVLVAELEGRVVGFAALRCNSENESEVVLTGVRPEHQRRGILHAMITGSLCWAVNQGRSRLTMSTQIVNLGSQKVLARLGFEVSSSYYTFHRWLDRRAGVVQGAAREARESS